MVFGEVRIAAEFLEYVAKCGVANGIRDEVYMFAVAAKAAVQQFKRTLVDADGCDGLACGGAFCNCIADDFFVFVDYAICGALETC